MTIPSPLIPRIVWQTWKTKVLPGITYEPRVSWGSKNPGWQVRLFDDEDCREFMRQEFPERVLRVYDSLPRPVMRADMWRYAVLAVHGGLYTDLDTTCNMPIHTWLNPKAQLVICPEPGFHWLQWTIAAAPGHPVMREVVEEVCRRVEAGYDNSRPDFVHYYTGPWVFGDVVWKAVRAAGVTAKSSEALTRDDRAKLLESGIQAMPTGYFVNIGVKHHYGGDQWHGQHGYVGWKRDKTGQ